MIECIPQYIGEPDCPECGSPHTEFTDLPERTLTIPECKTLVRKDGIDGILPIFRVHDHSEGGYYMKAIPAIVAITDLTVRVLWNNPLTDDGWIIIFEEEVVEPYDLGVEIARNLRESTYEETEVDGLEIVQHDTEIPELPAL